MRSIFISFFIFFLTSILYANNVILTIDKNELSLGEQTLLHVKVSNLSVKNTPEIKNLSNFNYQFIGTSSSITIINGKVNSQKEYNFLISPKKYGTFKIGPAVVKYKGKQFQSNTITVVVRKSKAQKRLNKYIFVSLKTDKNKVKVNEEIILTLKIYRKIDVTNLSLSIPEFKKAIVERLGREKTYSEIINGQQYIVTEIRYAVFPTVSGELKIDPFILKGEIIQDNFDNFFKNPFSFQIPFSKTFRVASNSLSIKVEPLKKDVYAVGDYVVTEKVDKTKAKVGENINLVITIKGRGNLQLSNSIKLKEVNGLKFYYDKPSIKVTKSFEGFYSEKTEKIAIVPDKKGKYLLPQIILTFYNPSTKKYERITLPKVYLNIFGKEKEKIKIVGKVKINNEKLKNEDYIQTIFTDFPLTNQNVNLNVRFIFLLFAPGILILLIGLVIKIFIKINREKKEYILSKNAFKIFKNNLKKANSYDELSECVKTYFINKFQLKKPGITFEEIIELLKKRYPESIVKEAIKNFKIIEECIYANRKEDLNKLKEELVHFVRMVESE